MSVIFWLIICVFVSSSVWRKFNRSAKSFRKHYASSRRREISYRSGRDNRTRY